jgi:hypothetical protein
MLSALSSSRYDAHLAKNNQHAAGCIPAEVRHF